ncbi:MAG: methionyl-tRNA formyltransferase [Chloroflexi bacterium]|nr:methionyl-tRNA formyltransferase [Chloroflexota bacterium]
MKLAIIGQSAFGKSVLEALNVLDQHQVVGVFAAPDRRRSREPLASAAKDLGIPCWQFERLRNQKSIDAFRSLEADLSVMAYVTDIVPAEIIEAPSLGTIQYHPSLLPLHRGPSSINWAVINGDTETGLSIFWPDEGLDTGPILMQKRVDIVPDDTVGSLYFNHLFPKGVDAILESVDLVNKGEAPRIVQDESKATYEGWCGSNDAQIDWSLDVGTVHNLIRGCDPQPGAWSTLNEEKVAFFGSSIANRGAVGQDPGTVLALNDQGVTIAVGGGSLTVKRVRIGRGRKTSAGDVGFSAGQRFS